MYLDYRVDKDGFITVWLIYMLMPDNTPVLYAFTQYKEILEEFKRFRKMDMFYVKKKKFTKDEYKETFISKSNVNWTGYYLERRAFKTCSSSNIYNVKNIEIVATGKEEIDTILKSDDFIVDMSSSLKKLNMYYFNDDIKKDLNKLHYKEIAEMSLPFISDEVHYRVHDLSLIQSSRFDLFDMLRDDLIIDSMEVDQFAIFITLFGNTLKGFGEDDDET